MRREKDTQRENGDTPHLFFTVAEVERATCNTCSCSRTIPPAPISSLLRDHFLQRIWCVNVYIHVSHPLLLSPPGLRLLLYGCTQDIRARVPPKRASKLFFDVEAQGYAKTSLRFCSEGSTHTAQNVLLLYVHTSEYTAHSSSSSSIGTGTAAAVGTQLTQTRSSAAR